jgi:hypothetical protein
MVLTPGLLGRSATFSGKIIGKDPFERTAKGVLKNSIKNFIDNIV